MQRMARLRKQTMDTNPKLLSQDVLDDTMERPPPPPLPPPLLVMPLRKRARRRSAVGPPSIPSSTPLSISPDATGKKPDEWEIFDQMSAALLEQMPEASDSDSDSKQAHADNSTRAEWAGALGIAESAVIVDTRLARKGATIQAAQQSQELIALQQMADEIHMKERAIEDERLRNAEEDERVKEEEDMEAEAKVKEEEDIDSIYTGPDKRKMRGKRHKRPT